MHPNPLNTSFQGLLAYGIPVHCKNPGSVLSGLMHLGLLPFLLAIPPVQAGPPAREALPTGAHYDPAQVDIATSGNRMTLTQSVQRAIVNWDSYDIGADAWVDYRQPGASSVTLNRVLSSDPSRIFGRLTANGQVWLINPSGVLFGPGCSVNVGALLASTLSISDDDFMNGRNLFVRNGALGSIVNHGEITADGNGGTNGLIALFAPEVRNEGLLAANLGTVALAAGDRIALDSGADGRLKLSVDPASVDALVENRHLIRAEGGQVILSARAASKLSGAVIQNGGVIEANSLTHRDGIIRLEANRISANGRLDVSAKEDTARGGSIMLLADTIATPDILLDASGGAQSQGGSILYKAREVSLSGEIRNSAGGSNIIDPATLTLGATVYGAGTFNIDADDSITVTGTQQLGAASTLVFRDETTVNPGSGTGLNIADDLVLNIDTASPFSINPGGVISGLGVRTINISGAGSSAQNSNAFGLANTLLNNQSAALSNPLDATIRLTGAYSGLVINAPNLDSLTLAGIDPDGIGGANPLTTSTGVSVTALGNAAALDGRPVSLGLSNLNLTGSVSLNHDLIGNNESATSSILINNVIASAVDLFNVSGSNRFEGSVGISNSFAQFGQILVSATGNVTIAANRQENANGTAIRVRNIRGNVAVDSNLIGGAADGAGIAVERVTGNVTIADNTIFSVRDAGPVTDVGLDGVVLDGRSIFVSEAGGKILIGGDAGFSGDAGIGATPGNGGGNFAETSANVARNFIHVVRSGDGSSDAVVIRNNIDSQGGADARSEGSIFIDRALGGVRVEANTLSEFVDGNAIHIRGASDVTSVPVTTGVIVDSNFIFGASDGAGIVVDRVGGAVTVSDNELRDVQNATATDRRSLGGILLDGTGIFVNGAAGKVRVGGSDIYVDSGSGSTLGNGGGNLAVTSNLIAPESFIVVIQSGDGSSDAVVVRNNEDLDQFGIASRNTGSTGSIFIDRALGGVSVQANSLLETANGNAIYIRGASDALSAPVTSDVIVEANLVAGATDGAGIAVDRVSGDVSIVDNEIGQIGNATGTNRLSLGGIVLDGISILVAGAPGKLRIGGDVAFGGAGTGASLNHGGGNRVTSGMDSAEGIRLQAVGDGSADAMFIGNNELTTSVGVFRNAAAINIIGLNGGGGISTNDLTNSPIGLRFENLNSAAGLPMLVNNNRFSGILDTGTGVQIVNSQVAGLTIRGNGFISESGSSIDTLIDIDAASTGLFDASFNYWGTTTDANALTEVNAILSRISDPAKVSITSVVTSATPGGIDLDNGAIGNTLTNGALANVAGYRVDGRQLIVLPDELSASTVGLPNRVQSGLDSIAASVAAANATNLLQPGAIAAVDPQLALLNGTYSGGNAVATDANLDGIRFFFENTDDSGAPLLAGGPRLSQGGFTLGAINASFEEGRLTTRDAIRFNAGSNLTLIDSLGAVRLTSTTGAIEFNGNIAGTGNDLTLSGGSFTNNGAIASDTLNVTGAGDFTNSASGSINLSNDLLATISGNFTNAGSILAADSIRVVSSGGSATLSGTGTLRANGAGGGTATPLVLAFSNGSFTNTAGTNAISAANDRWLVYVRSFQPDSFTPGGIETQGAANAGAGGVRTSFYARTYAGTDEAGINALESALGLTRGSRFVFADSPAPPLPPVPPFVNPPAPCQNTGGCGPNGDDTSNDARDGVNTGLPGDALFCSPGAASAGNTASDEDCLRLGSNGWQNCELTQDGSK